MFSYYARDGREMCEYIRAVLLRALRFLPIIYEEHWNIIVQYALQGSFIEQLMATETWLFFTGTPGFYEQEDFCVAIREELTKNVPQRLAKNYLLLLSEYDCEVPRHDFEAIPSLRQAYRISSRRDASELLNYVEPGLIRGQFYGGRRPGDFDSGHISQQACTAQYLKTMIKQEAASATRSMEARITSTSNKAGACLQQMGQALRKNVTIDWMLRKNVQVWIQVRVKHTQRRYGYPLDRRQKATQTLLEQAEVLCRDWTVA